MRLDRLPLYSLAQAAFLVAWGVLSSPWLFGWVTIPYDAKAHFQAQIQFLANALHSGQSPFWTPNVFVGSPQIADPQSMIFSPAFLLAYFDAVPTFHQLDVYILVLLAAAGMAAIKLFEDRHWHPAGAVLAAIAIAFGSSAAWRIQHIGQVQSYAMFCIALWLVDRTLRTSSWRAGIAAGLACGLMLAEPNQVGLLGAYVLAGMIAAHWLMADDRKGAMRHSLWPLLTAGAVTVVIAGVPLLLSALFVMASNRPAIALEEAAHGSLHPVSLLTALVGDLFGALDPKVEYWGPYSESWNPADLTLSQNMSQLYIGALPAVLMLTIGLTRRLLWAREIRALSIAAVVMVLYGLGTYTPVFEVLYKVVPGVAMFRRPADATFIIGALGAVLGGYMAHRWLSSDLPNAQRGWFAAKIVVVGGSLAIAAIVAVAEHKLAVATKPILVASAWIVASVVVFRSMRRVALNKPVWAILAVAGLMTADIAANNGPNESTAAAANSAAYDVLDPRSKNETIRFLKERVRRGSGTVWRDRVELLGLGFEWPNCSMVHGLENTLGYNPLRVGIVSTAIGARDHIAGADQRQFSPLMPSYRSLMANLTGLRFIASSVPIEQVDTKLGRGDLKLVARTKDAYIYENPAVVPRVVFARTTIKADFQQLVLDGQWPPFDPLSSVLLEGDGEPPAGTETSAALRGSNVAIARYENTIVDIDVDAATDGMVVLHDLWHPWWAAYVDDVPVKIHKANVMFRAVAVSAGRHRVRFEFSPFRGAVAELMGKALHER